ncbi:MAG: TolC family protein [Prevotella sp.]|uniref:TolC family protein n=1 Tax=Prevotella sp. AGR2160 TaxID=1280674 RepID=UPI00048C55BE|nr:TolC family protein [Prevotella sp. AGR2160]MDD5861737.1 TolC family protein [Prevotella sp.]
MRRIILFSLATMALVPAGAQRVLTLDSCRALALRNNKQYTVSRVKQDIATNVKKAARTKYLPKVDALGTYQFFSREISLLNKDQKSALSNLGTNIAQRGEGHLGDMYKQGVQNITSYLQQQGVSQDVITNLQKNMGQLGSDLQSQLNTFAQPFINDLNSDGQNIVDAFKTNTHNVFGAAVMVRQPVYMGGGIIAANKMADISVSMTQNDQDLTRQNTLYHIDQSYWMVVSLKQKLKLAEQYRDLVKKLDDDVYKMIKNGVATRADGLKVDVRVNESDMMVTKAEDGLSLSRMLLCQLCGLPMDDASGITLADEDRNDLSYVPSTTVDDLSDSLSNNRPELRLLQNTIDLTEQNTKVVRAVYLPHVFATGGYMVSNPNVYNGFQRNFGGVWNIGLTVQIPLWNWGEGAYKVRAARAATNIAQLEYDDTREKIQLQVSQSRYRLREARKRLITAEKNIKSAEENLRCANLGFKEGVMQTTDVMAAQTAWQEAQSQKIDAEVDVRLAESNLQKALGNL